MPSRPELPAGAETDCRASGDGATLFEGFDLEKNAPIMEGFRQTNRLYKCSTQVTNNNFSSCLIRARPPEYRTLGFGATVRPQTGHTHPGPHITCFATDRVVSRLTMHSNVLNSGKAACSPVRHVCPSPSGHRGCRGAIVARLAAAPQGIIAARRLAILTRCSPLGIAEPVMAEVRFQRGSAVGCCTQDVTPS